MTCITQKKFFLFLKNNSQIQPLRNATGLNKFPLPFFFQERGVGNWHDAEAQNETYLEQMLVFLKKSREMSRCSDCAEARRAAHCSAERQSSEELSLHTDTNCERDLRLHRPVSLINVDL